MSNSVTEAVATLPEHRQLADTLLCLTPPDCGECLYPYDQACQVATEVLKRTTEVTPIDFRVVSIDYDKLNAALESAELEYLQKLDGCPGIADNRCGKFTY